MASHTPPDRRSTGAPSAPPRSRPPGVMQWLLTQGRRVFFVVAGFYCVLAVLGLITALINGQMITLSWPLLLLLVFIVGYGIFAWFAEPLYLAAERRRAQEARERESGKGG